MINYSSEILPYKRLANIEIGKNISIYLADLYENCQVEFTIYSEGKKNEIHLYHVNSDLKISSLANGEIVNIISIKHYSGILDNKIRSGMTVQELKENSKRININHGCLFLDGNFGFCFILPPPYDEIGDTINHLPNDLILNEMSVANYDWWYKPELTPEYAK